MIYNNEKINNENKNYIQIYNENDKNKIISEKINNPKDICFSNVILTQSYSFWGLDNTFTVFKSINDILYLVYSNNKNSIIAYDLIDNKEIIEIKYFKYSPHDSITNIRYFLDNIYKRDLIMSVYGNSRNIKIWNINNFELKHSKEQTFFIDIYNDITFNKIYILTANKGNIKVYDYNNNKVKNIYYDNNNAYHRSIIIHDNDSIIKIIESCDDGIIRIWDFNSGELLNRIK